MLRGRIKLKNKLGQLCLKPSACGKKRPSEDRAHNFCTVSVTGTQEGLMMKWFFMCESRHKLVVMGPMQQVGQASN